MWYYLLGEKNPAIVFVFDLADAEFGVTAM
jgi:hypothetical protein